jgi:ABC-type phosphate/phosphonate transport system substrate-binding protein
VASVDSYVLDLLRLHDPALAASVRVVGATAASPIPPLVGGALDADAAGRFRAALLGLERDAAGRELLGQVALRGFRLVGASEYSVTIETERVACSCAATDRTPA